MFTFILGKIYKSEYEEYIYKFQVIIFLLFLWRPLLSCGGAWATAQFAPTPLKCGPGRDGGGK